MYRCINSVTFDLSIVQGSCHCRQGSKTGGEEEQRTEHADGGWETSCWPVQRTGKGSNHCVVEQVRGYISCVAEQVTCQNIVLWNRSGGQIIVLWNRSGVKSCCGTGQGVKSLCCKTGQGLNHYCRTYQWSNYCVADRLEVKSLRWRLG